MDQCIVNIFNDLGTNFSPKAIGRVVTVLPTAGCQIQMS